MNARYLLFIVAIIASIVFLTIVALFAGFAGVLFGFIAVAAILLRFASFLGFFNIPPLARTLNSGAMVCALIVIIITGISRQISFAPSPSASVNNASTTPPAATYSLCADGEYDFSNLDIKKVGKVEFPVSRRDCWIKVTLPSKDCVTHDSTVEVKRVWDDGATDVEGPNRINKSHTGNIIFIKSLQGEGVYKILARR